jgi:hypothetical protein
VKELNSKKDEYNIPSSVDIFDNDFKKRSIQNKWVEDLKDA